MDGATQRASKLIQIEFFLGHREKAASVQFCIAEEFKKRPMKGVRPRFRSHEHGRTRPGPIFGRVVISKNFKFLNGVGRRADGPGVVKDGVVENPVQSEVVLLATLTIH